MYYDPWGYTPAESRSKWAYMKERVPEGNDAVRGVEGDFNGWTRGVISQGVPRTLNSPLVQTGRGCGLLNAVVIDDANTPEFWYILSSRGVLAKPTLVDIDSETTFTRSPARHGGNELTRWKLSGIKYSTGARTPMCSRTAPTTTTTTRALRVAVMKDAERTATSGGDANGEDSRIDTFLKVKNVKEWLAAARPIPFPVADLEAFSAHQVFTYLRLHPIRLHKEFNGKASFLHRSFVLGVYAKSTFRRRIGASFRSRSFEQQENRYNNLVILLPKFSGVLENIWDPAGRKSTDVFVMKTPVRIERLEEGETEGRKELKSTHGVSSRIVLVCLQFDGKIPRRFLRSVRVVVAGGKKQNFRPERISRAWHVRK
ncbi:hypothetical protein B0H11DRAFT_1929518 [Mycena galericulata]|nr:hypothetical protein B0H11DRAFT_1929518 [Mycena galericulata]